MIKIPKLSSANTAKFVTRNRKMRFMSLFFGETNRNIGKANHNMVTRLRLGRDVPSQFQAAAPGRGASSARRPDDRWADKPVGAGNIRG
jgi:hypothetical protein